MITPKYSVQVHYAWDWERSHRFELNPTGRWKIKRFSDKSVLYLEHKTLFSRKWIAEDDLHLIEVAYEFINDCSC